MVSRSPILCLSSLGEDFQELVAGDALTTIDLGDAFLEPRVEGGLSDLKPFLLGLEEVESLGDDLGGGGVVAALKFALDALFGCGIEGDRHGGSIPPVRFKLRPGWIGGSEYPTHAMRLHESAHPA
jgi:hypothetical protein